MNNLGRRLDALEARMTSQQAAAGQMRAILADRLLTLAQRSGDSERPPQSTMERLVSDALEGGDFWPAITRGLRQYLAERRAS